MEPFLDGINEGYIFGECWKVVLCCDNHDLDRDKNTSGKIIRCPNLTLTWAGIMLIRFFREGSKNLAFSMLS